MQQGRVQLDADWNEQNSIDFHYERSALRDIVGDSGTPIDSVTGYSGGFEIRLRSSISATPSTATPLTLVTVQGTNFALHSDVSLALDLGSGGVPLTPATKVQTDATGAFSGAQFYVPSSLAPGAHTLSATDSDGNSASVIFVVASGPGLSLSPSFGLTSSSVTLYGYGFKAGDIVTITPGVSGATAVPPAPTVDADGSFSSTITIPSSASPGSYTLKARDQHGNSPSLSFFVLGGTPSLSVSPSSGLPSDQVTATGAGMPPSSNLTLRWDDALSPSVGQVSSDATGAFSGVQFKVPSSATGGLHTVLVTDANGLAVYATANFAVASYIIKHGHYYVDGILCENEEDLDAAQQPDLPLIKGGSPALPSGSGTAIVYLEVWERHLNYLDDPEIREVALLGPDTATRTKIVWQVKLLPVTGKEIRCDANFPAWDYLVTPSSGELSARAKPTQPTGDVCVPPAEAGYTSLQNQLYRVEIHNGGELGASSLSTTTSGTSNSGQNILTVNSTDGFVVGDQIAINTGGADQESATIASIQDGHSLKLESNLANTHPSNEPVTVGPPTFKWSRDNGTVVSKVSKIDTSDATQTVLTVSSTGKNPNLSFATDMWVEITSDLNDLYRVPGTITKVLDVDQARNTIKISPAPSVVVGPSVTDANYPQNQNPKVRRWDWVQGSAETPPYQARIPAGNDGYIELEKGVEVKFSQSTYRTGDYWLIPARSATADVDWPEMLTGVNWASVPTAGLDAANLATFLTQRFGLDGIQPFQFTPNGPSEIDATFQDPSNVSHTLSLSLNNENTFATLTVDGIVGAEIPVVTESDGSLTLKCGIPEARPPEGIEHHYARLALLQYNQETEPVSAAASPSPTSPTSGPNRISPPLLSISPQSANLSPGQGTNAQLNVVNPTSGDDIYSAKLSPSAPSGITVALTPSTLTELLPGNTQSASLNITTDPGIAPGNYTVTINYVGIGSSSQPATSATMTIMVGVPLVVLSDCRQTFPPLTDIPKLFYVSGDGQTANPDYSLPSPLMAATWFGSVRFTIVKGSGTLSNPVAGSASGSDSFIDVKPGSGTPDPSSYPDMDGIAWVTWTIDHTTQDQLVRAELLDADGNITAHLPLYYNAILPAGQTQGATTGILELYIAPKMRPPLAKGVTFVFGTFKHFANTPAGVPPAIILGYVGFRSRQGGDFPKLGRVTAMEDAGLYPFATQSNPGVNAWSGGPVPHGYLNPFSTQANPGPYSTQANPMPMPLFKALFIDDTNFSVAVDRVVLPSNAAGQILADTLILRWWAMPAADMTSKEPKPPYSGDPKQFWWNTG